MLEQDEGSDFETVIAAWRRLQRSRAVVIQVAREELKVKATARLSPTISEQDKADIALLARKLNLPGRRDGEFNIVFGASQATPDQLAIFTRSMFEVLAEMAAGVDVPDADRAAQRAVPLSGQSANLRPLFRVRSGSTRPADPHVAVRYRDKWFWVDGGDAASKRAFLLAQVLLSLSDTSGTGTGPLVTIPAN